MLSLPTPSVEHRTVYELSREKFVDQAYTGRLEQGQNDILNFGVDYHEKGLAGHLTAIAEAMDVLPHILSGDMPRLYEKGFLRKNSDARKIYEELRLSSPYRICPFCLHRNVKTLDHYLPKSSFAAFAVLPQNLVPSCRDCNAEKLRFAADEISTSLLHPYYDHVDDLHWLGCQFIQDDGYWCPQFFINSENVNGTIRDRLISHMKELELFELYDVVAAREINETKSQIRQTFLNGGPSAVVNLCVEMGNSRAVLASNYWRAVLWRTAATVDEFCNAVWA